MLEILEEGDLSDGGARGALLVLQPDLLQGHHRLSQHGLPLEHRRIRSLQHRVNIS